MSKLIENLSQKITVYNEGQDLPFFSFKISCGRKAKITNLISFHVPFWVFDIIKKRSSEFREIFPKKPGGGCNHHFQGVLSTIFWWTPIFRSFLQGVEPWPRTFGSLVPTRLRESSEASGGFFGMKRRPWRMFSICMKCLTKEQDYIFIIYNIYNL